MIQGFPPAMDDAASAESDAAQLRTWSELRAQLRPFVARRLSCDADVDDVLQEVLLRTQRGLEHLRDGQRFGPWVYQVARNAITDHQRALGRRGVALESGVDPELLMGAQEADLNEPEGARGSDAVSAVEREVSRYAAMFLSLLPEPYREALTLTELEGLTQQQAADRLGLSVSGMKSRVQRGRQKLRAELEACCHISLDARHRVVSCEPRRRGSPPDGCCG